MAAAAPVAPPPLTTRTSTAKGHTRLRANHGGEDGRAPPSPGYEPTSPMKQAAAATTTNPSAARPQPRPSRPPTADFLSDKTTAALIRRTLCPQASLDRGRTAPAPIEDLLPPLTSRNDVDLQLYALISIILRESVQNWYGKITPDETFVAEIVQIIAHVTRALEQRLRKVDLESLLFDELPDLLDAHVRSYRIAKHASAARPPLESSLREVYHSLWPLPALSPVPHRKDGVSDQEQNENELAYRQLLVQGVLALLLPTEDLQNECLVAIVGQILSELIIGNLMIAKLSQPWLLWEIFIILTRLGQKQQSSARQQDLEPGSGGKANIPESKRHGSILTSLFWSIMQSLFVMLNIGRLLFSTVALSRSLPPRTSFQSHTPKSTLRPDGKPYAASISSDVYAATPDVPVASFAIWSCLGNLIEVQTRMPWLGGALALLQWGGLSGPGKVANVDGVLDRLMSHCIQTYMLAPDHLPPLLRSIRGALFPNNAPGTSTLTPPSSDEELAALKRRCARAIWGAVPKRVGRLYYGASAWAWLRSPLSISKHGGGQLQQPSAVAAANEMRSDPLQKTNSAFQAEVDPNGTRVDLGLGSGRTQDNDQQQQQHGIAHVGDAVAAGAATAHVTLANNAAAHRRARPTRQQSSISSSATAEATPSPNQPTSNTPGRPTPGMAHPSKKIIDHAGSGRGSAAAAEKEAQEEDPETERAIMEIESGILDLFSDPYCNKHLLYGVLELILVRLMPELTERGVVDLLEERLA
ncbi:PXA domain-containing protein [Microdochium trichocladiopsis]|uniref:PXA domain-containing protein n=1 Tax=Microdochium trichocladiopsis TaxID=1682393 RepID=A0A9P9C0H7_9PEZI|nr:PXA domain-containing protein [Microdochium trichocladiopsis]KAH7041114.1 PXA domain-containing protein [Microdochium trichocladiopsis]